MSFIIPTQATPVTPAASNIQVFANNSKLGAQVDDAGLVRVFASIDGTEVLTNKTLTAPSVSGEVLQAGSTSVAPLTFTLGTNLTTPAAGAEEYDGANFFGTPDTTSGRGQIFASQRFYLTSDGGALGAGIADYFGTNSAYPYVASWTYLIEYHCYFLKTTAGTLTWTLTSTQTYTNLNAFWLGNVITGFGATGAMSGAGVSKQTTAATALPVTGSLSTATDHYYIIRAIVQFGTAGNIRLRVTNSAGTVTPRQGSYYIATRISNINTGTFVA